MMAAAVSTAVQAGDERGLAVAARPPGFIPIGEAIRRALNSPQYTGAKTREAARAFVRRLIAAADVDPRPVLHAGQTYLHPSIHPAFSQLPEKDRSAATIKMLPQGKRAKVLAMVQVVRDFADYRGRGQPGHCVGRTAALAAFVAARREHYTYNDGGRQVRLVLTVRTVARWIAKDKAGGADALAVDGRGRYERKAPDDAAVKMYDALRHDPKKRSIRACWRLVADEAEKNGWRWFTNGDTCAAWDRLHRNTRALVLNQRGDLAYRQQAGRFIEPDPQSYEPGECWIGDDSTFDVWVCMPDGRVLRPVGSWWEDWRSRAIVGYRVAAEGNEHTLLLAFSEGAATFGLPSFAHIDNGKNFASWQWRGDRPKRRQYRAAGQIAEQAEGIFNLCDVRPQWATPYNPNSKAREERFFRTIGDQFCRELPSYCGGCADDRPEAHARLVEKAVEWQPFVDALHNYVGVYNNRPHGADDMEGRTPLQVMALATHKRVITDDQRALIFQAWQRPISIGRNGVAIRVCGATVRYGWNEPALRALPIGTKVRIGFDPEDMAAVTVWTLDYRWICRAQANQRFNRKVAGEDLRQTMREIASEKRALRRARDVGVSALRDPVERTLSALARDAERRRRPDPEPPAGGPILRPVQTPVEVPAKPLRKAVGAESLAASAEPGQGGMAEAMQKLEECNARERAKRDSQRRERTIFGRLHDWAGRERQHA